MVTSLDPYPHELPSTYIVLDMPNREELVRLTILDNSINALMGGVLPEQPDPGDFHEVLDIGSGPGGWAIQAAKTYPTMSLLGIDISKQMITHANTQAEQEQVSDRVKFQLMDALNPLDLPNATFDLVNMRLANSFLRVWEWKKVVSEMLRVTRPGGVIRITDTLDLGQSNSPALLQFRKWIEEAMARANYYFEDKKTTITEQLITILEQFRCSQVQTRQFTLTYQSGTPEWQAFYDYVRYSFRTLRPFLQRRGCAPKEYDAICQQALNEMKQPDFHATWRMVTVWGKQRDQDKTTVNN